MDTDDKIASAKKDKGFVVVWFVVLLPVVLLFALMAVDFSHMYVVKGQLQNAADSAALAGAGRLNDAMFLNQTSARSSAKIFAYQNKSAGEPVETDLNLNNVSSGDIVVGNWDPVNKNFNDIVSNRKVNAVKVVARRTSESGLGISSDNKQVNIIFGNLFNRSEMGTKSEAIASLSLNRGKAPVLLCMNSVTQFAGSNTQFYVNNNSMINKSMAWTLFDCNPSVNANDIITLLSDETKFNEYEDYCSNPCVNSTNATSPINTFDFLFNDTGWDSGNKSINSGVVNSWDVLIPIVDGTCSAANSCTACVANNSCTSTPTGCPPYSQGGNQEPYHIAGWATVTITSVNATGGGNQKGFSGIITGYAPCPNPFQNLPGVKRIIKLTR